MRRSTLAERISKSLGPHHLSRRSGSVQAFHTRSRGASNTREMTNSNSPTCLASLFATAIILLLFSLCLNVAQIIFKAVQRFVPEVTVGLKPAINSLERFR